MIWIYFSCTLDWPWGWVVKKTQLLDMYCALKKGNKSNTYVKCLAKVRSFKELSSLPTKVPKPTIVEISAALLLGHIHIIGNCLLNGCFIKSNYSKFNYIFFSDIYLKINISKYTLKCELKKASQSEILFSWYHDLTASKL